MTGDCHVRFREGVGVRLPRATRLFIERLCRSVKYQDVYIKEYRSIGELRQGLRKWFDRYDKRRHQGIGNRAPDEVYWSTLPGVRNVG